MQNPKMLSGIKACVFDAYGTLLDFASAAQECRDQLGEQTAELTALWRDKQLQYTWLRSLQGRYVDFWQVTGDALDFAMETLQINNPELRDRLMDKYRLLSCFQEVPEMLQQLKSSGQITAILSNGSPDMLSAAISHAKIDHLIDHVFSVDDVKIFKPDPRVYQLAVDQLRVSAHEIAFMSSNGWDAYSASAFGMKVVWCNRYGAQRERLPGNPDVEITTLAPLPSLVLS